MAKGPRGIIGIEPAKTGRSCCAQCKTPIAVNEPRVITEEKAPPWIIGTNIRYLCQKCGLKVLKDEKKNIKGLIKRLKHGFVHSRSS